jgi:large subunit ribosomal protein L17
MDKKVTEKLFAELAPRYSERSGGYTRIVKLQPRLGDGAPMVQLQLVE